MSGMETHISFEELVDLVDGRLSSGRAAEARSHLESCSRCAEELAWIKKTTALMSTDDMVDAPMDLVTRAVRAFHPANTPAQTGILAGPLERLVALLQFDSGRMAPAVGLRSGQVDVRQMLYSTDLGDIDLRISAVGDLWEVSGQLLGERESGTVRLSGDGISVEADVDEHCEFQLAPVHAGVYVLTVWFDGAEITVPDLRIGEARGTP